jgi:hypothetical protein
MVVVALIPIATVRTTVIVNTCDLRSSRSA